MPAALVIVACALIAQSAAMASDELPMPLPPVIPPDSIFSDAQRAPASMAMVPPSNDHTTLLPEANTPRTHAPQIDPSNIDLAPGEVLLTDEPEEKLHHDVWVLPWIMGPDKPLRQMTYRKTFLPPGGNNLFGIVDVAIEAMVIPKHLLFGSPLVITPYFTFHWFEGNSPFPVPGTVYDVGLELAHVRPVTDRLSVDIAVAPSVFSDFVNAQSQPFRVVGRGVALYDITPTAKVALGATYLGRDDIKVLPIAGLLWRPARWEIDALFPKPRVAWNFDKPPLLDRFTRTRIAPWLGFSPVQQFWLYTAGELGGNTWAVREAGIDDRLTYFDLRLMLGIEQRATEGPRGRFEIGYVWDRKVSYLNGPSSLLHDTFMMRGEMAH
ncbi:MAG TPA: hypothetical protein VG713_21490 [Pirellulales bacterium]|nr:hypothetical protein [Pirellulales bacterium]